MLTLLYTVLHVLYTVAYCLAVYAALYHIVFSNSRLAPQSLAWAFTKRRNCNSGGLVLFPGRLQTRRLRASTFEGSSWSPASHSVWLRLAYFAWPTLPKSHVAWPTSLGSFRLAHFARVSIPLDINFCTRRNCFGSLIVNKKREDYFQFPQMLECLKPAFLKFKMTENLKVSKLRALTNMQMLKFSNSQTTLFKYLQAHTITTFQLQCWSVADWVAGELFLSTGERLKNWTCIQSLIILKLTSQLLNISDLGAFVSFNVA